MGKKSKKARARDRKNSEAPSNAPPRHDSSTRLRAQSTAPEARVSEAPVSAARGSEAPVSEPPIAAARVSEAPVSAAPVSAAPPEPPAFELRAAEPSIVPAAPETPEAPEHRNSTRVSVAVDIHLASDSHFFSGLSGDISEGGVFLSTYRPLRVGSSVDIEFSLPGSDATVHARGQVRWLREHSADQPRGVGIAFENLSAEDRERIHEFCSMRPPLYYEDVG